MKKVIVLFSFFLFSLNNLYPQEYQLTTISGSFTPLDGGTNLPSIQVNNGFTYPIDIGFNFSLGDEEYSQLYASSDGFVILMNDSEGKKGSSKGIGMDNSLSMFYSWDYPTIAPLWDDLSGDIGSASYKTEGNAPNRTFTLEWLNWKWDNTASSAVISFQIKLYETSNKIEFIYRQESGNVSTSSTYPGASIGLAVPNNGFYSLNNTGTAPTLSSSIETNNILTKPVTGQIYQFQYLAKPEPTNHVTSLAASNYGNRITLNWTDAPGTVLPDGYLILASKTNSFTDPTDSVDVISDNDLSDGVSCVKVLQGTQTYQGFINAEFNSTYYFKIYPFSNRGKLIDYKTSGDVPQASVLCSPLPEPTNYVTSFSSSTDGSIISLSWIDATGTTIPDGYLIMTSKTNSFTGPIDGVDPTDDLNLEGDGFGVVKVPNGTQSFNGFTNAEPQATYYSRIYNYTNSGTFINFKTDGTVPQTSVLLIKPEPTNHVTDFSVTNASGNLTLSWTDATGSVTPKGYLILASKTNNFIVPTDNNDITVDNDLSDGIGVVKVDYGAQTYSSWVNADTSSIYYYRIYPYTNSENYVDYKTSATVPQTIYVPHITFTEQTSISIVGASSGTVEWGDYDNDGYLDLLRTGVDNSNNRRTIVYHNNGDNTFTEQTGIVLDQIANGTAVWGDYNNDGYLDIMISGSTNSGWISKVYTNNGNGIFSEQAKIVLTNAQYTCAAWGDYNNDGHSDLLYSGSANPYQVTKLYRNDGDSTFTEQTNCPISGYLSSIDWGDYDNDGYLDVLTTGSDGSGNWFTKLYHNNGNNAFAEVTNTSLLNVSGYGKFGDYDNDGYLDIILNGLDGLHGYSVSAKVYKNNGNATFTEQTQISIGGVYYGSVAWGDYNNDGYLDILQSGSPYYDQPRGSKIYRNMGNGTFVEETGITLDNAEEGSVAWVDYDNDGDLDFIITGDDNGNTIAKIYRNDGVIKNTPPQAPTNLKAVDYGKTVTLSWDKSLDVETPQSGLTYNIYVGTSPTKQDIVSPNANINSGKRILVKKGDIQTNSYTLKNLNGGTYYWSVQAIDGGFASSQFASQSTFSVTHYNSIAPTDDQALILGQSGTPLTVSEPVVPDSRQWKYSLSMGGPYDITLDGETNSSYTPRFTDGGAHYVVCVSIIGGVSVTSNEVKINANYFTELSTIDLPTVTDGAAAWGDYNNDGYKDLLITGTDRLNSSFPPNAIAKIYKNNGDGTFTEQTGINLTGVYESAVAWGDYDNDGYLDILLTGTTDNYHTGAIAKVYHNNGDNTFTEMAGISLTGVHKGSAAWGDYNNDGYLDIFISGYDVAGNSVFKIYRNDKTNFTETKMNIIPFADGKFDLGDYNRDGYLDIVMSGYDYSGNTMTRIYTNDGNGGYTLLPNTNFAGMNKCNVLWGDYDNDGYLDILLLGTTNNYSGTTKVYHNNGNGTFTEQTSFSLVGVNIGSTAWGDYDNDGYLDIIITGSVDSWPSGGVSKIYRNNGNGTFSEQASISLPALSSSSATWCDYDNDGDLDLLLFGTLTSDVHSTKLFRSNCVNTSDIPSSPENLTSKVIAGNAILKWSKANSTKTAMDGLTYNIVVASFPDTLIVKTSMSDIHTGLRKVVEPGNAGHDTTYVIKDLPQGIYYWAVQTIDNAFKGSTFSDWKSFEILPQYTEKQTISGYNNMYIDWVDYNNDNHLDFFFTGSQDFGNVVISKMYRNMNNGTFAELSNISIPGVCTANSGGSIREDYENLNYNAGVAWGDYNNDGLLDVIVAGDTNSYHSTPLTKLYNNNGDGTFTEQTKASFPPFSYGASVAWGDYDNDGHQDILISGIKYTSSGSGYGVTEVYRNNGDSTFTLQSNINLMYAVNGSVAWGDYDNDGYLDIIITGSGYSNIYHNNGDGTFTNQTNVKLEGVINSNVTWADYNNDGYLDILITGMDSDYNRITKIYRNNGDGTFTDINAFIRGVIGGSVAWGDYDNDGDLDLLMTGKSGSVITVIYRNDGNDNFTELDFGLDQVVKGYAAFGDFDNDGDLDIVSGGKCLLSNNSYTFRTKVYQNNGNYINDAPTASKNLRVDRIGDNYRFSWDAATDDKTPSTTLTYNLRIGKVPSGRDILSPLSKSDTTSLLIPIMGNCQLSKTKVMESLKPGTYYWSVQAIDQTYKVGQWAEEQTLEVSPLVADFTASNVCAGFATQFTDISIASSESITSWHWQFGDDSVSYQASPSHTYANSGDYSVTLTIQSASYQSSITKSVNVKPKPKVSFTAPAVCIGSATTFKNNTTIPSGLSASWIWNFGDNQTSTDQQPAPHGYLNAGSHHVSLKTTVSNGCSDSISIDAIVATIPNATLMLDYGSPTFCKGDSVQYSVQYNSNYNYQWTRDGDNIPEVTNVLKVKNTSGNYKIVIVNSLASTCSATSIEKLITVMDLPQKPVVIVPNNVTLFCPGTEVELKIDNYSSSSQYQWKRSGVAIDGANQQLYSGKLTAGDYSVEVNPEGCSSESDMLTLTTKQAPTKPNIFAKGSNVWILACDNKSATDYKWYYNDQLVVGAKSYQYIANQNLGNYYVEVNEGGECYSMSDIINIPSGNITNDIDILTSDAVVLFPNPTYGKVNIALGLTIPGETEMQIIDALGNTITSNKYQNSSGFSIDLTGFAKGIYLCKIRNGNSVVFKKIVKR